MKCSNIMVVVLSDFSYDFSVLVSIKSVQIVKNLLKNSKAPPKQYENTKKYLQSINEINFK